MSGAILVVDDSLTVRMDICDALTAAGFSPVACKTLFEAREALRKQTFAVVILDVLLPDGDGIDLLSELRASPDGSTPVMLLSTEAQVRDRVRGLTKGADDYIGKPYEIGYVVARAHELVRRGTDASAEQASTILLIDDSLTFREELRRALMEGGHRVVVAESGEEGLRVAADLRPSAVIVEGNLPGIHGATVVRRMRLDGALRRTPCLLLTGSDDDGAELRALDAGADAFVRKGEDITVILARLAAVLRRAATPATGDSATSLSGAKKILAVDDSRTHLESLAEALREEGYDVALAQSGEEALELLALQPVDCVLLDLNMPGLGGEATCRRIKDAPSIRDTPLIIVTSSEDRESVLRSLGAGADDIITKSSDAQVLKARILTQIRRKQFEDETRRTRDHVMRKEREKTEARASRVLADTRARLLLDLERKNRELEAFSYSVSHDLRAPLRAIDGFSLALLEDHASQLDEDGQDYLRRVRSAAQRMGELIDDLLHLSRMSRAELIRTSVDLSGLAREVGAKLREANPERQVRFSVEDGIVAHGDPRLLQVVLENLIGNAWKFTGRTTDSAIDFGASPRGGEMTYFVRDNGAGFDMAYSARLFGPFQRLHTEKEFSGTGIGLATVQRIVERHGGRIWAEGEVDRGATLLFTLPAVSAELQS